MKKFLSLVLALVMVCSLLTFSAGAKEFTDASSITYKNAVDVISTINVVDGYTDSSFGPTSTLTRGAAAKIICNLVLGPTTASALGADAKPFKDVATDNVFAGYIAYCSQQGIINGYADGTFKPAGTVTGYQFLKMLLGALGYDGAANVEGFVGNNWTINVAKLALGLGLTSGNNAFVGNNAMTREEACLYAFNTLKATMVEYNSTGTNITVGDTTITTGASKASDVRNSTNTDGNIYVSGYANGKDGLMQFAERYFNNLKCQSVVDDLGRQALKWTYNGAKIGTYTDSTASVTYTATTKESAVKTDMNSYSYNTAAIDVFMNGVKTTSVMNNAKIAGYTGNGTLVEVYTDNNTVNKVVVAQAYLGKVTSVSSKNETITVALDTATGTKTITDTEGYGSFVKDDMVMVVPAYSAATNSSASIITGNSSTTNAKILSIAAAQKVTGRITSVKTNSYLVMDGTTYNYAAQKSNAFNTNGATVNNSTDVDIYLDAYGYVVDATATASAGNYLYVAGNGWDGNDSYGGTSVNAQVVLSDGTISSVVVSKVNNVAATKEAVVRGIYRYTISSNKYNLVSTDSYIAPVATAAISSSTYSVGGKYFSNSTNFVVVGGSFGSTLTATVYTGKQTTSGTATCYFTTTTAGGNTIATIFVTNTDVVTNSNDLIYCANGASQGSISAGDSTYDAYELYVNGQSMTVATKNTTPVAGRFYTYGVDANGVYSLTDKTSNATTAPVAVTSMYNSQYVTIASISGLVDYSASDAIVVDTNSDDDYEIGSIGDIQSALEENATVMVSVVYNTTDKTVTAIYVTSVTAAA